MLIKDENKDLDTLNKWKEEASPFALLNDFNALRVLTLIDLVRKKDEALKYIITQTPYAEAYDALELTKELK